MTRPRRRHVMPHIPIIDPSEDPRTRTRRRLMCAAHRTLAELLDALVAPPAADDPLTVTVRDRAGGLRLVLRLVAYDGDGWEPAPKQPTATAPAARLTAQQRQIVAACNRDTPTTAKRIARVLGRRDVSSYLRDQLRRLVAQGLLRREGGGYVVA